MRLERSTEFNRNTGIDTKEPFHIPVEKFYGNNKKDSRIVKILNERQTLESTASSTIAEPQFINVANTAQNTLLSQHTVSASTAVRSVNRPPEIDSLSDTIASSRLLFIDEVSRFEMTDDVAAIGLSKNGSFLVVAQDNGDVCLLDTASGAIQREWRQASQNNHSVEPMQASDEDVSMDCGSELASDEEEPMDYDSESDDDIRVSCLALAANQQQLAVGRDDGQIRLYNLSGAQGVEADNESISLDSSQMPTDDCVRLAFTAHDQRLIAVRENGNVDLCDIQNGGVFFRQRLSIDSGRSDHMASHVTSHAVSSTVSVITPSSNKLLKVNFLTGECQSVHELGAEATAVLETDDYYGIAHCPSDDQAELFIYDRHTAEFRHQINVSPDEVNQGKITMSSDGRWLLCGARGRIRMVDLSGVESERTIAIGSHWDLAGLVCHPECPWIVLASERLVRVCEVIAQEPEIMPINAWVEE